MKTESRITKIIKRDGKLVDFDKEKIAKAIFAAAQAVGGKDRDLAEALELSDRVAVMYAGHVVELAAVDELFRHPVHPYTEALLKSIPRLDRSGQEISPIPGTVPPIDRMPIGCRFAERCNYRIEICTQQNAELLPWAQKSEHLVRCWVKGAQDQEKNHA